MKQYTLVSEDLSYYIDPFTNKRAIFDSQISAQMTAMMLFDQQQREFKVEALN